MGVGIVKEEALLSNPAMGLWITAAARSVGVLLTLAGMVACATPPPLTPWASTTLVNTSPLEPAALEKIFKVSGREIKNGRGDKLTLRGIAFGNEAWANTPLPSAHHTGRDFARVRTMGMNSVRFYLSYRTFEEDEAPGEYKEDGFAWVDQNVEWAKQNGIYLVLNMHAPESGVQSRGQGDALWDDPEKQERFINLWRVLAERYRAEPTVVGYGLLNEPAPTKDPEQWKDLAERTVKAIRDVDQHHMIFVGRFNAVQGVWTENQEHNFVRVSDPNVVYEFHFYKPYHFTHQNAAYSAFAARESWYPDPQVPEVDHFELVAEARAESQPLPAGDSDWTLLETKPFVVDKPNLQIAKPFLVCDQGKGEAYFDTLSLTRLRAEKDEEEPGGEPELPEPVFELDLDTRRGWAFLSEDGKGSAEFVPKGHGDHTALVIKGTTGPASLGADPHRFFLEQGAEYQLQALGRGVGLDKQSSCLLRLEFYSSPTLIEARGKEALQNEIEAYLDWGKKEDVPLYVGEFGTIRDSFLPGRGGLKWVEDVLDVLLSEEVHFAYHAYHEKAFGLYMVEGVPTRYGANLPLQELFAQKLGGQVPDPQRPADGSQAEEEEEYGSETPKAAPETAQPDDSTMDLD